MHIYIQSNNTIHTASRRCGRRQYKRRTSTTKSLEMSTIMLGDLSVVELVSFRHIDLILTEQMLTYIGHRTGSSGCRCGGVIPDLPRHVNRLVQVVLELQRWINAPNLGAGSVGKPRLAREEEKRLEKPKTRKEMGEGGQEEQAPVLDETEVAG